MPSKQNEQRVNRGIWLTVFACVGFMVLVMGLFLNRMSMTPELTREDLLQHGVVIFKNPREVYEGELQWVKDSKPFRKDDLAGKWHFVFFGFTQCPDICPTTLAEMVRQKAALDLEVSNGVDLMFVSLDTERDGAEQVQSYLGYFDPGITGLHGTYGEISSFASSLNAAFSIVPEGDSYTIDHTGSIFILGPDGQYHGFIKNVEQMSLAADFVAQ